MVKYKKIYLDYHGLDVSDWIPCLVCCKTAIDIHHITFKSQGGTDEIENLAALCRECHNKAHSSKEFNENIRKLKNN